MYNCEQDKSVVLDWMRRFCYGFKNARTRKDILPYLNLPDRYFRRIASILKHEGHLASTSDKGYWFIPIETKDPEEINAALQSCLEMKARAMDIVADCDKHIKRWEDKKRIATQGQMAFA
jgi:hypothetical protein